MKNRKHVGSSFESFLEEEGIFEEVNVAAIKAVIANNLKKYIKRTAITKTEIAKELKTSRAGLERLLDPENYSVTLLVLNRAAKILGKKVDISLINAHKPRNVTVKSKK
jgi:antitoxin HicB